MSNKTRNAYTAEERVSILRRHLLDHVPVSDLCDEYHLHPTQFYRWQRQFFENGAPRSRLTHPPHRRTPRFSPFRRPHHETSAFTLVCAILFLSPWQASSEEYCYRPSHLTS